ncbi:MAG: T9SS type A sorting domain-containing protein [Lewinellaceae bacterium]|nr:T9SS type A sorting domain-containing protein [Lewinellaceae bacterium]
MEYCPNPVSDQVTLNLEGWNGKTGFLIVNDALGHEMLNQRLTRETIIFEVKNWLSGIYVIQIQQETGSVWSSKFVVQH